MRIHPTSIGLHLAGFPQTKTQTKLGTIIAVETKTMKI